MEMLRTFSSLIPFFLFVIIFLRFEAEWAYLPLTFQKILGIEMELLNRADMCNKKW